MTAVTIRPERDGDIPAIEQVTRDAFVGHPHSDGSEPAIVAGLRRAGDLKVSLVAERDEVVIGHIAFSPVTIDETVGGWYGLGPVSVSPDWQRHGVGGALIRAGLEALRGGGAAGCVLLGEPEYYTRFGFSGDHALAFPGVPEGYFMMLGFDDHVASGVVRYAPAFG